MLAEISPKSMEMFKRCPIPTAARHDAAVEETYEDCEHAVEPIEMEERALEKEEPKSDTR